MTDSLTEHAESAASTLDELLQQVLPQASLSKTHLPLTPQLKLWLLDPDFHHHPYSAQESAAIMDNPPYWSFCWASGQVLAAHILTQPELVSGKTVLDFGAGSGVVAIAALMAGADRVIACDLDGAARRACAENARLNGVNLGLSNSLSEIDGKVDILFAADVLYDLDNYALLHRFADYADEIIIADSRAKEVAPAVYRQIAEREATTLPDYGEFDEFKRVKIYRSISSHSSAHLL